MTKITNKMRNKRFNTLSKAGAAHGMLLEGTPFMYRAPHANRPTAPRKMFA